MLTACAGSGGGAGSPVTSPPGGSGQFVGAFVADNPTPASGSVTALQSGPNGTTVEVAVTLTEVNDIFGASFQVAYDPTTVDYVGYSPGNVLETGGDTPTYLVSEDAAAGRVDVGASRSSGALPTVDVASTRTLMTLRFAMLQPGTHQLDFQNNTILVVVGGNPPQGDPSLSWAAGEFQAN